MSRGNLRENAVTYAAIGGTRASNLMTYPPSGFRPTERRNRLGSGRTRFETASRALMRWGVQRGSGIVVNDQTEGTGERYTGMEFDSAGNPQGLRGTLASGDSRGGDVDIDIIRSGMSAVLVGRCGPFRFRAPVRVVYVIDEENQKGFAYGTLPGHPLSGEEAFFVEIHDDDSVWIVIRTFSRVARGFNRIFPLVPRIIQRVLYTRYSRALLPTRIS